MTYLCISGPLHGQWVPEVPEDYTPLDDALGFCALHLPRAERITQQEESPMAFLAEIILENYSGDSSHHSGDHFEIYFPQNLSPFWP